MAIPTEPIGSIPRPAQLIEAGHYLAAGRITAADYARLAEAAVREAAADIRGALEAGAHSVQIDFTEGRLAVKLDPSGQLLRFAKIRARVAGTRLAAARLGL